MKKSFSMASTDGTEEPLSAPPSSPFEIRFGENTPRKNSKHPVTLTIRHTILPGNEMVYAQWAHEMGQLVTHFEGFVDAQVRSCESNECITILRFDTYDHLQAWMNSVERRTQLAKATGFDTEPIQVTYHSLEFLFVNAASDTAGVAHPSKAKMAVVIFLLIWFQSHYIAPNTIGKIKALSPVGKQALSILMIVIMTVFLILPIVTKYILHWWLFPNPSKQARWVQLLNCSWRPTTTTDPPGVAKKGDTLEPPQDDYV
jgi:antibiotic biosynthesis monooxygenase (ABM) superfamily enzyme